MKTVIRISFLLILAAVLTNCRKKSHPSTREEQLQNEVTQPLLANEILEQEGVRFILNYSQDDAQISLNLEGGGAGETAALSTNQPYVNYFVEAPKLTENSDYTISVGFTNVKNSGTFSLSVIGFTDLNKSKVFTISDIAFTPA